MPLAPLLLEGDAPDVLNEAYHQYRDNFSKLKLPLAALQPECWWEGEHGGTEANKILRRRDRPMSRQQWTFGERTVNQGPLILKEAPCTCQK